MHMGVISSGRLREEEELRGERHALDEDGRREAAAAVAQPAQHESVVAVRLHGSEHQLLIRVRVGG